MDTNVNKYETFNSCHDNFFLNSGVVPKSVHSLFLVGQNLQLLQILPFD